MQTRLMKMDLADSSTERRKTQKKSYRDSDSMSSRSNHVESDKAEGEKDHSSSISTKMKRQKVSASSSGLRTGLDVNSPTYVMRSRKGKQEGDHNHVESLSWLIDNSEILPREKVYYGSPQMSQGEVFREGIICSCCQVVFTLSGFACHAGDSDTHGACSNHRPAANIFRFDGSSLLDCQTQITKMRKRRCIAQELVSRSDDQINFDWFSDDCISFTWRISKFSSLPPKYYSDSFDFCDLIWKILMYPTGNNVDDLSLYLDVQGESELPFGWSGCVLSRFTVVNLSQYSKSITRETKFVFNERESQCGFTSVIPLAELGDLVDDTLVLEASIEYVKAQDPSSLALKATSSKNMTAFLHASSSIGVCIENSDTQSTDSRLKTTSEQGTNHSLAANMETVTEHEIAFQDTEHENVYSTSACELLNFSGVANVKKEFAPILEEVCSLHPSLIEIQKRGTPRFTEWAFIALGEVLHFLETKKVKDMKPDVCDDLKFLWKEVGVFGLDLDWLAPRVERALSVSKLLERASELDRLREHVNAMEAKLAIARSDLKQAEEDEKKMLDTKL